MKKFVKVKTPSPQEDKRKFAIKLINKKISKPEVMRISKISERTYRRFKDLIKKKGALKAGQRKTRSGGARKLTKARKISIMNSLRANPFQSTRNLGDKFHGRIHHTTIYRYLISAGFDKIQQVIFNSWKEMLMNDLNWQNL